MSNCDCKSSNSGFITGSIIIGCYIFLGLVFMGNDIKLGLIHMGHDVSGWTEDDDEQPTTSGVEGVQ